MSESGKSFLSCDLFAGIKKIDISSILTFFTQFAFLIRVGVPLFKGLEMLITQTKDDRLERLLNDLKKNLAEGASLSEAMRQHRNIFTNLHINMIVVGENSGKISEAFERLVTIVNEEQEIKKKIKKALTYPLVMLVMNTIVIAGMLLFVFPKFSKIFMTTGVELPAATRFLMDISAIISGNFYIVMSVSAGIIAIGIFFIRSKQGIYCIDRLKFKIPFIKELFINIMIANFARTFGSLLTSGVTIIRSLEICRETASNTMVEDMFTELIKEVREGNGMSAYLGKIDIFPSLFVQLIAIGENSGQMDTMSLHIYEYYKQRVEESLTKFTAMIEPVLMVFFGGMVTIMAISLFLPMFKLTGTIRRR